MAKVLIVGCGDIGLGLAEVLIAEGHQVSAIKRKPLVANVPGLAVVLADIAIAGELVKLPTDFEQVYVILSPDSWLEASYRRVYQQGINNLLEHFMGANITGVIKGSPLKHGQRRQASPHWIFVSSTSVYGQNTGEWIDEGSLTEPLNFNGKVLLQAEKIIFAAGSTNTIVRFSGIYGPGREGLINRVESAEPVQYWPPYYTNRIHREDCIGVLAWLLKQRLGGSSVDNIYLASDSDPAPMREVASWLARQLAAARPPELQGGFLGSNKRCANGRLREQGYEFRFHSYREGYALRGR